MSVIKRKSASRERSPAAIVVLSLPGVGHGMQNPFLRLWADAMPDTVCIRSFTWRRGIFSSFDVLQLHWVEHLVHPSRAPYLVPKYVAILLLLARCKIRRIPLVLTLHNVVPHARQKWYERVMARLVHSTITATVLLNESRNVGYGQKVVIKHGHYRSLFPADCTYAVTGGHVIFLGAIEPYKRVVELIRVFGSADLSNVRLTIKGPANNAGYARAVLSAAGMIGTRVSVDLRFASDSEIFEALSSADLCVLPIENLYNSGSALYALSAAIPILVPDTAASRLLRAEAGPPWVQLYSGELTAGHVVRGLATASRLMRGVDRPNLAERDWDQIAAQYEHFYRLLLSQVRRTRCSR